MNHLDCAIEFVVSSLSNHERIFHTLCAAGFETTDSLFCCRFEWNEKSFSLFDTGVTSNFQRTRGTLTMLPGVIS
jgi:hypothetical protein